ncbi:hypothetical protein BZZ01_25395 [Nostocales cyanobacterium HT-58-2]|nr:hypothetical protein BZZ01_25395 [Nostocales cyanobacterium HT-58-2]
MRYRLSSIRCALFLGLSFCFLLSSVSVKAAQRVILKYSIFREPVSVEEISTFTQTGKLSSSLEASFAAARQDPKLIRKYLAEPVKVDPIILDKVLNSPVGNPILDQLSQVIHTPSNKANRQALRSALVLSASMDQQITLIEIIQNYPTSEVEVEGERLENANRQLRRLQGNLQDLLGF